MKGEIRAQRPTLASFQGGRGDARNQNLLARIQERQANGARQATLVLRRTREEKPLLARQQVEAVKFEGTGRVRSRAGAVSTAIAAGLLVLIAPNLGTAEPTRASATVQIETEDNPFGFEKGKTTVAEIGAKLGAKGIGELEWILDERGSVATLLVADGVKAVYWFENGVYQGIVADMNVNGFDLSKARNWTMTVGPLGRTFVTAENFLARDTDGVFKLAIFMEGLENGKQVCTSVVIASIVAEEGGFRNPHLQRFGKLVFLHAEKSDGTPWTKVYAFNGFTGEYVGEKTADPAFLSKVGLAMLAP